MIAIFQDMQIHETAFVVSTYRSLHEDVSKDNYAKLWNNPATNALLPTIFKEVSPYEGILHAIRNRFFYESLRSFFNKHKGGTFINFGAGFSMYQFILDDSVNTIDIDKKEILDFKKDRIGKWTAEGKLPHRNIQYLSINFNTAQKEEIVYSLRPLITKKPTFILLEGVLFFLNKNTTDKLFDTFKVLQGKDDLVGSVSYISSIKNTKVYSRLINYFDKNNDTNDSFMHQTIPHSYYEQIPNYRLARATSEFNLLEEYSPAHSSIKENEILNEHLYLLQKM
ncbi:class I SAM-dependent methyltransferase [Spongiivirga sp. MCCC 1A20706]|uniref:class I SAM-dependent methyltransferase n=1 Tax=Spongiivirga sp. MCCC 1A20706 TaxID=3160963 RepID=UPI003977A9A7